MDVRVRVRVNLLNELMDVILQGRDLTYNQDFWMLLKIEISDLPHSPGV